MALNPDEIENMDSETMAIRAEAALRSVAMSSSLTSSFSSSLSSS